MDIETEYLDTFLEEIPQIRKAHYKPHLITTLQKPLELDRLRAVEIHGGPDNNNAMNLSILLSVIPSFRKLKVSSARNSSLYYSSHPHYCAGVEEFDISGRVDSNFLADLISRTGNLQKFSYRHEIEYQAESPADFSPFGLVKSLELHAGHSLGHLDWILLSQGSADSESNRDLFRHNRALFMGPLRGLKTLRTLQASVDFLIKTANFWGVYDRGSGTVQKLADTLPASLQTFALDQGLEEWDACTMTGLFRGISKDKEGYLLKLTAVGFVRCPDFKWLLSDKTKAECQSAGVKLSYISSECGSSVVGRHLRRRYIGRRVPG